MRLYLTLLIVFLFSNCNNYIKNEFIALEIYGCDTFQKRIDDEKTINQFERAIKNSKLNDVYLKYNTTYSIKAIKEEDTLVFYIDEDLFVKNKEVFISKRNLYKILGIEKCK